MSYFEIYSFRAVDRALSPEEQARLRQASTRATITPRSFRNSYSYGSFGGDVSGWMDRYFDAYCHEDSTGSVELILKLPVGAMGREVLDDYQGIPGLGLEKKRGHALVSFCIEEGESRWLEEDGDPLEGLLPLREELMLGDQRALYLAWLAGRGDLGADKSGPPVPPGLGKLSNAQRQLAAILRVPSELIEAAAEASQPLAGPLSLVEARRIVKALGPRTNEWLARVAVGDDTVLQEVRREVSTRRDRVATEVIRRAASELLQRAEELRLTREERARTKAFKERNARLDMIAKQGSAVWARASEQLKNRASSSRSSAVELLGDLKDLSEREGTQARFHERLGALRAEHRRHSAVHRLLDRAGL